MTKFIGNIEELQKLVADLGFEGQWKALPNQVHHFTGPEGAILNWWETTKTVQFQGPKEIKPVFEAQVTRAIAEWTPTTNSKKLSSAKTVNPAPPENKRVFVVHGHDHISRDQLSLILYELGLKPFVLANTGGDGLTLIEALEKEIGPGPGRCRFGIVLMTPDDMGYAKSDGPEKAEPRARQNVVLEMGMLIAALGRSNVAILQKGYVDVPSDVKGIIYIGFNDHVKETVTKLVDRLNQAGFNLDAQSIARATA